MKLLQIKRVVRKLRLPNKLPIILAIHIGAFLLLGAFTGCSNGANDDTINEPYDSRPIVCFGDSLTYGYGASDGKNYPDFLQRRVNVPVINAGVNGDTTVNALNRINSDVLEKDPQLVIIEFGGNDLFHGITAARIKSNLQAMIRRVNNGSRKIYISNWIPETGSTDASLFLVNILRSANGASSLTQDQLKKFIVDFNAALQSLSATANVEIVDNIFEGIYGNTQLMNDPLHPNSQGYEIMADNYFKAIEPYLKANNLLR